MKKALLGLSNNIGVNFNKIKIWSKSFKKYSDGEVILLCANSNEHELNMCRDLGITAVSVKVDNVSLINHKRLLNTLEFLKTSDTDLFLITDVFDVVFQSDPFLKWDLECDVFVGGEGVLVSEEPWNSDNINKLFPEEFKKCLQQEIICSGVIGGKRESLIKLYDRMYNLCENSKDGHNIKDQAALITMVVNNEIENLQIFDLNDGWVVHCAVAGPTQFFESWGFKSRLMNRFDGIPKMENGCVLSSKNIKYDIVHQFNRIPEWNKLLTNEYV